jgi:hypothetical protein
LPFRADEINKSAVLEDILLGRASFLGIRVSTPKNRSAPTNRAPEKRVNNCWALRAFMVLWLPEEVVCVY